jgi:hypothetical protein
MSMHQRRLILAGIIALFTAAPLLADGPQSITPTIRITPIPSTTRPATPSVPVTINDRAAGDLVEFLSRKAALKDNDTEGRVSLARWARDRELWSQAAEVAKEALDRDPDNRGAWSLLQQVDQAISLPEEPDTAAALLNEFNHRFNRDNLTPARANAMFKTRNSRHFLICYDTSDAFAAQRGGVLEKSYDAFMFFFNMQKLRPAFLDKRLVVILFKDRNDYLAYAKATEGADLGWAAGYYSQRTNRSAFYDDSSGPAVEGVEKKIEQAKARLRDLNIQIQQAREQGKNARAGALSRQREELSNAIFQVNNRVDNALGVMNTVKTAHEAAHQLAFNTGIQKRRVDYPLWLCEGLACCFELEDRTNHRGPAVLNTGRIGVVKEAVLRDKLIPLEKFIGEPQPKVMDENTMSVFYAEGWALFHYLYKTNRSGLEKYLISYNNLPVGRQIPNTLRRKLFTDAFGDDIPNLERRFVNYLKDLPSRPPA